MGDTKIDYVAGFLFDDNGGRVVLIEKQKPSWQKGLYNGIGGKIEANELPDEAMRREFEEETGVDVEGWTRFARLKGESDVEWRVHFFYTLNTNALLDVKDGRQPTEERPFVFWIDELRTVPKIPNLAWLIPMALTMSKENAAQFSIEESYESVSVCERREQREKLKAKQEAEEV